MADVSANINSIINSVRGGMGTFSTYFTNISSEFPIIESALMIFIVCSGVMISAWGVLDFVRLGNPRYQSSPTKVAVKVIVGAATVQLVFLMMSIAEVFFGERALAMNESLAMTYADKAAAAGDPTKMLLFTIFGFLVLVGWVTGLRAMISFARIGSQGQASYDLFKAGAARLLAAVILSCFQFFLDDLFSSAINQTFSSSFNL